MTRLRSRVLDRVPARLAGRMRRAKANRSRGRYPRRTVSHTYAGRRLELTIGSPYGEMYDADWPVLPEIALLAEHRLRPGARVFDLGANHGVIALMLAGVVGPTGHVVALEADRDGAELVALNSRRNGIDQITAVHAAAAARSGSVSFAPSGVVDGPAGRLGGVPVPALSIDDLAAEHGPPDVVFADVEGYEAEVLRGASGVLGRAVDWYVEIHGDEALSAYGDRVEDVVEAFDPERFELHCAEDRLARLDSGEVVSGTTFAPCVPEGLPRTRVMLVALARSV